MKFRMFNNTRWIAGVGVVTLILLGALAVVVSSTAAEPQTEKKKAESPTNISTGSGKQYKTTVHRKTEGELSPEDFRQSPRDLPHPKRRSGS